MLDWSHKLDFDILQYSTSIRHIRKSVVFFLCQTESTWVRLSFDMHRSSAYVSSPAALLPSWLIGSSRTDCVNLKSLFSCRFYLSLLCTRRNVGFSCEKCDSQQASLCHFSVISVWYPEGGLNCDRNGRNELICSAEASIHLNVIQLVPVSLKWSSIFFSVSLVMCTWVQVCIRVSVLVHVQVYVLWAHSLGCRVDPVSCRLPPACYHGDPIWESIIVSWQGWNPPVNVPREKESLLLCNFSNYIYISHFISFSWNKL